MQSSLYYYMMIFPVCQGFFVFQFLKSYANYQMYFTYYDSSHSFIWRFIFYEHMYLYIDRLVHHSQLLIIGGDSWRFKLSLLNHPYQKPHGILPAAPPQGWGCTAGRHPVFRFLLFVTDTVTTSISKCYPRIVVWEGIDSPFWFRKIVGERH